MVSLALSHEFKSHPVYDMEVHYAGLEEREHQFEVSLFNRGETEIDLSDDVHRMIEIDVYKNRQDRDDYIEVENLSWEEPILSNFVLDENDMVHITTRLEEHQLEAGRYRFIFKVLSEEGDEYTVYLPLELK